jgi:excisionase family DNA binding protein
MDALLDQSQVGDLLGLSVRTIERLRATGAGPVFVKVGRSVRYRAADVAEWVESCTRTSTSETPSPSTVARPPR